MTTKDCSDCRGRCRVGHCSNHHREHARLQTMTGETPELKGSSLHGGYRLYTRDELPFDDVPAVIDGGPATVVIDGWGVSYSTNIEWPGGRPNAAETDGRWQLKAYKFEGPEEGFARHEIDGTIYEDRREATRAAYEAGLLAFMVYEDQQPTFAAHQTARTESKELA